MSSSCVRARIIEVSYGIISVPRSRLAVIPVRFTVNIYRFSVHSRRGRSLVELCVAMRRSPVASGSSVPACQILVVWSIFLSLRITS